MNTPKSKTTMDGLVSVVVPTKNSERYLRATLASVLSQTYRPLEVIVVDGRSTDRTRNIVEKFPSVRFIEESEPVGIANARNLGIRNARGEFIAIISSDDLWESTKIELQVDALLKNPDAMYCVCRLEYFLPPGETVPDGFREELLGKDPVGHMPETLLARAELFSQIGLFESGYGIAEDLEWFQRARDQHVPMTIVSETLLRKRVHSSSLSTQRTRYLRDTMYLLRRRVTNHRRGRNGSDQDDGRG